MIQKIKLKIIQFFEERSKVWGVDYATNLLPEFIITDHAKKRMDERMTVAKRKQMKMTVKAWQSNLVVPHKNYLEYRNRFDKEKNSEFRSYMGFIFVFRIDKYPNVNEKIKVLITVFKQKRKT